MVPNQYLNINRRSSGKGFQFCLSGDNRLITYRLWSQHMKVSIEIKLGFELINPLAYYESVEEIYAESPYSLRREYYWSDCSGNDTSAYCEVFWEYKEMAMIWNIYQMCARCFSVSKTLYLCKGVSCLHGRISKLNFPLIQPSGNKGHFSILACEKTIAPTSHSHNRDDFRKKPPFLYKMALYLVQA